MASAEESALIVVASTVLVGRAVIMVDRDDAGLRG